MHYLTVFWPDVLLTFHSVESYSIYVTVTDGGMQFDLFVRCCCGVPADSFLIVLFSECRIVHSGGDTVPLLVRWMVLFLPVTVVTVLPMGDSWWWYSISDCRKWLTLPGDYLLLWLRYLPIPFLFFLFYSHVYSSLIRYCICSQILDLFNFPLILFVVVLSHNYGDHSDWRHQRTMEAIGVTDYSVLDGVYSILWWVCVHLLPLHTIWLLNWCSIWCSLHLNCLWLLRWMELLFLRWIQCTLMRFRACVLRSIGPLHRCDTGRCLLMTIYSSQISAVTVSCIVLDSDHGRPCGRYSTAGGYCRLLWRLHSLYTDDYCYRWWWAVMLLIPYCCCYSIDTEVMTWYSGGVVNWFTLLVMYCCRYY